MMKRKIEKEINDWIKKSDTALVIDGARKVGKTYIIRHCLNEAAVKYVEVNLLDNCLARDLIENSKSVNECIRRLYLIFEGKLIPHETTIFIDECQESLELLTIIKGLVVDNRFRYILAGSHLGTYVKNIRSIPIGYITRYKMYPLDFEEYLLAQGQSKMISMIFDSYYNGVEFSDPIHDFIMFHFNKYLTIGGLPKAITNFIETDNYHEVRKYLKQVLDIYCEDFTKCSVDSKPSIEQVFRSIPGFLLKANRKFVISQVEKNARYERALNNIEWLRASGYTYFCYMTDKMAVDINMYNDTSFKLYLFDIGLLTSMYNLETVYHIWNNDSLVNCGGLYENYFAGELSSRKLDCIYYNKNNIGEIDFLLRTTGELFLIEIKSGADNKTHNSLNNVMKSKVKFKSRGIVFSKSKKVETINGITYYPIYFSIPFLSEFKKKFE